MNDDRVDLIRDKLEVPVAWLPSFLNRHAHENQTTDNWLVICWGGLGDVVCAEPSIRYMVHRYPNRKITLWTRWPETFAHLQNKVHDIILLREDGEGAPNALEYRVFQTGYGGQSMLWEFLDPAFLPAVDFISLAMLKRQLDPKDRQICLHRGRSDHPFFRDFIRNPARFIILHAGKTWPSRTAPWAWWEELSQLVARNWVPVLIGRDQPDMSYPNGVHDFPAPPGAIDLRNDPGIKISDLITFLTHADKVFTNDSAPLHIAAGGDSRIGYVSTARPGWMLKHWRNGFSGWNQWDYAIQNVYQFINQDPTALHERQLDQLPENWCWTEALPPPSFVADSLASLWKVPGYAQ